MCVKLITFIFMSRGNIFYQIQVFYLCFEPIYYNSGVVFFTVIEA